jgi:hypothetical protein
MALSKTILTKQPAETRLLSMGFDNKMVTGELITSIDSMVSDPAGLTFAGESFSGQIAQALISGGTIPDRADCNEREYKVTFTISTDMNQVLENDGILIVRED